MSHLFLLQPRQVWLTPVQGLCLVTHGLPAVYECQSLHATRAAIKTACEQQLSMTCSSGNATQSHLSLATRQLLLTRLCGSKYEVLGSLLGVSGSPCMQSLTQLVGRSFQGTRTFLHIYYWSSNMTLQHHCLAAAFKTLLQHSCGPKVQG